MSNENEPATKKDLAELSANLSAELSASLSSKLSASLSSELSASLSSELSASLSSELSANLSADFTAKQTSMEKRLLLEIGHAVNVVIEQIGAKVAVIDDKYDGPVRQLRVDLDAHCADSALHTRPAPLAPKRISRRKSQRTR